MASETTFDHRKVVFSLVEVRKMPFFSKPFNGPILIFWNLILYTFLCTKIKKITMGNFFSLDACLSPMLRSNSVLKRIFTFSMKGAIRYKIVFMDRILYFDKNDSMIIQTKDLISTFLMKGVIRYTTVFMGRLARRQALSSSWQFDCNCLRCQVNISIHPSIHPLRMFINST